MLFKRDKLLSMRNNSLGRVLDQILAYETKDVVDRLNMFHVVNLRALRFSLKKQPRSRTKKLSVLLNRTFKF